MVADVNIRILLVEDDKTTQNALLLFLQKKGYIVDVADTLDAAIKKFNSQYSIVILDILLGKQKSFPLLKKIKEEAPNTHVIVITAYDDAENIEEAKRLKANAFITKPFLIENLDPILLKKIEEIKKKIS